MANKFKKREDKKQNNQEPTDIFSGKSPDQDRRDKRNKKANAWRNEINEYFDKKRQ